MTPDRYSFLLRIWQAGSPEAPLWRASLEDAYTHCRIGFDSLEALDQFIRLLPGLTSLDEGMKAANSASPSHDGAENGGRLDTSP